MSDETTKETISNVKKEFGYLLDPHGAVAYHALDEYLKLNPNEKGFILETAHPVKFNNVVEPIIGEEIEIPASVKELLKKSKLSKLISPKVEVLKEVLLG